MIAVLLEVAQFNILYHEFHRVSQGVISADGFVWFAFRIRLPVNGLGLEKKMLCSVHTSHNLDV